MARLLYLLLLVGMCLLHSIIAVADRDIEQILTSEIDPDLDLYGDNQDAGAEEDKDLSDSLLAGSEGDAEEKGDVGVAKTEGDVGDDDNEEGGEKLHDFRGVTKRKARAQWIDSLTSLLPDKWKGIVGGIGNLFKRRSRRKPQQNYQQRGCHQTCTFIRSCTGSSCASPRKSCLKEYCYPRSSGYRSVGRQPRNKYYGPMNGKYRYRFG